MKFAVLGMILAAALSTQAQHCLIDHIKEGIDLNDARKSEYFNMSNGESSEISETIIRYEGWAIFYTRLMGTEMKAERLRSVGVNFLCDEFQTKPNPNPVELQTENLPKIENFKPFDYKSARKLLKPALATRNLSLFYAEILKMIAELNKQPKFNCMTRHILESQARIAKLAIQDNRRISQALDLIEDVGLAYYGSRHLDKMAAPLQAKGIPILCHDLPIIEF